MSGSSLHLSRKLPVYLSLLFLIFYLAIVVLAWPSRGESIAVFDGDAAPETLATESAPPPASDEPSAISTPVTPPEDADTPEAAEATDASERLVIRRWWWSAFLGTAVLALAAAIGFYYLSRRN